MTTGGTTSARRSLGDALFRSHFNVALAGLCFLVASLGAILWLRAGARQVVEVRQPLAAQASHAYGGLQRAAAALHGWVALGEDRFRVERKAAWEDEILPAVAAVEAMRGELDESDVAQLARLREILADLKEAEWWIEDVAQTPGNDPAGYRLATEVEPLADYIDTAAKDLFRGLDPATEGALLQDLGLFLAAFAESRAALERLVRNAAADVEAGFDAAAEVSRRRLLSAETVARAGDAELARRIESIGKEFAVYRHAALDLVAVQQLSEGDRANKMLRDTASPMSREATALLSALWRNQEALLATEAARVRRIGDVAAVVTLLICVLTCLVAASMSRRSSARIIAPVLALRDAADAMATGALDRDVPVTTQDEIGELTLNFNRMRHTIQQSEEQLRIAVDASPNGLLLVTSKGEIVMINRMIEQLFGYREDELLGRPVEMLLPERVRAIHPAMRDSFFADPAPRRMGEGRDLRAAKKDGSEFEVEIGLSPIELRGERMALGAIADITDRKRREQIVLDARDAAEQANRTKSEFLANMGHELRTPLNSVIGFSNILLRNKAGRLGAAEIEKLERVRDNGMHLLDLINEILDLAKIEAGKMALLPVDFDIGELVAHTVEELRGGAEIKGISLVAELPDQRAILHADETRMKQVLINLLGNAVKFTPEGGVTVVLHADAESGAPVSLEVRDTGIGVPVDKLEQIFRPFEQADIRTTKAYGGTGLGLTICRDLLEMMGFDLTVDSVVGEGSTFIVRFGDQPAARQAGVAASRAASDAASVEPRAAAPYRPTALVIDPDANACALLREALARDGCDVTVAANGEEGLGAMRDLRPDVVVLGLELPDLSAWQVQEHLHADPALKDVPVVVVGEIDDETRAVFVGAVDFINKPFAAEEVARIIAVHARPSDPLALVVEDDADTRALMRELLVEQGVAVMVAENGKVGLDRLAESIPDLIFLDLMMPVMDGVDFLARIRHDSRYVDIPVIIVTAKDLTEMEVEYLRQRTDHVVHKGGRLEADLASIVARVKDERRAPRAD